MLLGLSIPFDVRFSPVFVYALIGGAALLLLLLMAVASNRRKLKKLEANGKAKRKIGGQKVPAFVLIGIVLLFGGLIVRQLITG